MRLMTTMAAAVLALTVGVGAAQTAAPKLVPKTREPLTIHFTDVRLDAFLDSLSESTGISIQFAEEVTERPTIKTIAFSRVTLEDVLTVVLTHLHLTYTVVDEKTVLVIRPQP